MTANSVEKRRKKTTNIFPPERAERLLGGSSGDSVDLEMQRVNVTVHVARLVNVCFCVVALVRGDEDYRFFSWLPSLLGPFCLWSVSLRNASIISFPSWNQRIDSHSRLQ